MVPWSARRPLTPEEPTDSGNGRWVLSYLGGLAPASSSQPNQDPGVDEAPGNHAPQERHDEESVQNRLSSRGRNALPAHSTA